ncbi:MAG: diadenylate cyclase CdaA [Bacteroidales bacterium]
MFFKDGALGEQLKYMDLDFTNPFTLIGILIDIAIVSYLAYKIMVLLKETRASSLLKGLLLILVLALVSKILNLRTISYLLDNILTFAALSIVVIFQPELRKILEKIGASGFKKFFVVNSEEKKIQTISMIDELVKACVELSAQYIGAIIIVEREVKIGEFINTGLKMDSETTSQLLQNIFSPNTPLHDGAVIIRGDRIMAAACFLPLTDNQNLSKELGSRHRAALGITEISDCIAVVVSEESGKISYSLNGGLVRNLTQDTLRKALVTNLIQEEKEKAGVKKRLWKRRTPGAKKNQA